MGANLAIDMFAACDRFLVATKAARSKNVLALNKKLDRLFQGAITESVRQYKLSHSSQSAVSPIRGSLDEMDALILDSVMREVTAPGPAEELIRQSAFTASHRTMDRLTGNVQEVLAQGVEQGLGIDRITQNLKSEFTDLADYELERIARTEIHQAVNVNAYEKRKAAGIRYHMWVTSGLDNVRSSHIPLNRQIVKMGDRFQNELKHPGDRSGPVAEWIQCNCEAIAWILPPGKAVPAGKGKMAFALKWFYEGDLIQITPEEAQEVGKPGAVAVKKPDWSEFEKRSASDVKSAGTAALRKEAIKRGLPKPVANSLKGQDLRAIMRNPDRLDEILTKAGGKALKTKPVPAGKPATFPKKAGRATSKRKVPKKYVDDLDDLHKEDLREAIKEYTESEYTEFRDYQMSGRRDDENLNILIGSIEDAAKNIQPYQGTVHRGMTMDDEDFRLVRRKMKTGKTVKFDAMTSTSTSNTVAKNFAAVGEGEGENAIIMHFGKTSSGMDLDYLLKKVVKTSNKEKEVLFMKGSKFKIVDVGEPKVSGSAFLGTEATRVEIWLQEIP